MNNLMRIFSAGSLIIVLILSATCSKQDEKQPTSNDIWDIDSKGIPKFVNFNYIELNKIGRISRFRSSVGHDYSDSFEQCRSMKHYFEPKGDLDWSSVQIFSPISGKVTRSEEEWAGTKLEIASAEYPAFRITIFHINLKKPLAIDETVIAGQELGKHIGSQTMSDISVIVNDPTKQGRMVSYIDIVSDEVFKQYIQRGVKEREQLMITREERDAFPLFCSGEEFVSSDTIQNWVVLN
jgi:hypothetical protein